VPSGSGISTRDAATIRLRRTWRDRKPSTRAASSGARWCTSSRKTMTGAASSARAASARSSSRPAAPLVLIEIFARRGPIATRIAATTCSGAMPGRTPTRTAGAIVQSTRSRASSNRRNTNSLLPTPPTPYTRCKVSRSNSATARASSASRPTQVGTARGNGGASGGGIVRVRRALVLTSAV
jgi:hypothetical protein